MLVDVHMRNSLSGEKRVFRDPHDYAADDFIAYLWSDGNFGCDCNRSLFFARAVGAEEIDAPCGQTQFEVEKIVDRASGAVVYRDSGRR